MARTFERTHPHITFDIDLGRAPASVWMLLGESQSKCDHLAGTPLDPEFGRELHLVTLSKGVKATTAIEGNTLSEEQVRQAAEGELEVPPSLQYQKQEVQNILRALNDLGSPERDLELTPEFICQLNRRVLVGLDLPSEVVPGEVRSHSVGVGRYRGAPPEDCAFLLGEMCTLLNRFGRDALGVGNGAAVGMIKACLAHLYIAWIHPFGDGNGRTARLLEFCLLRDARVPSAAAHLLTNHYNLTRGRYYQMLDEARSRGVFPFLEYALEGFRDGLRTHLERIREEQWKVAWTQFVYGEFRGRKGQASTRQRDLVLAVSEIGAWFPIRSIRRHPDLAESYAGKTSKTVTRDVNMLVEAKLLYRKDGEIRAAMDRILAYLPHRKRADGDQIDTLDALSEAVAV